MALMEVRPTRSRPLQAATSPACAAARQIRRAHRSRALRAPLSSSSSSSSWQAAPLVPGSCSCSAVRGAPQARRRPRRRLRQPPAPPDASEEFEEQGEQEGEEEEEEEGLLSGSTSKQHKELQRQQPGSSSAPQPPLSAASSGLEPDGEEGLDGQDASKDSEEGADEQEGLPAPQHIIVEQEFLSPSFAGQLREVFDSRFRDPRSTSRSRFLWDYWHVPNQYTLMRTQAQAYFPKPLYDQLVEELLSFGESQLGCRAITPIWMSYYINGCCQELHCDSYHGPYAFVLSLTHWDARKFTGGETMILKPQVTNFWQGFDPARGLELGDLVTLVEPQFNQLTLFDPRFPHGVRPVQGTQDPLQSRLVLHGWFTDPSPFFSGPLQEEEALEALNEALEPLLEALQELPPVLGMLSVRLVVSGEEGSVLDVELLADTLVVLPQGWTGLGYGDDGLTEQEVRAAVHSTVVEHLKQGSFPAASGGKTGDTLITLPLVFE